jgi:peptidoglycan/LPS O-acetylase OafA/YrhL
MGASGEIKGNIPRKIGNFLGEISYHIYIIHYPFIYIFSAYVVDKKPSMLESLPAALTAFFGTILVAYLSLKLYDIPVRKWLMKKYIKK